MNRQELRDIVRGQIPDELSAVVGDVRMNSIIRRQSLALCRFIGGFMNSEDLSTDASGFATLPSDCLKINRVDYDGERMEMCQKNAIVTLAGSDS